jgi:hypothetical protein
MAEAMQGIMSLPEGQPSDVGSFDPNNYSPLIEGYARSDPKQFGRDILGGMAEVDPNLVDGFIRELAAIDLPPEIIEALQLMVDGILSDPSTYVEDRAELIAEGVPEELLPETFDPSYFAALNIAVDQLAMSMPPEVPGFAEGGIINARVIAKELAGMGRNGDTMLAHITPLEARMLRKMGGSGTINPETGLPEFFFKKVFKAVGKVFKSVGKAVKSVVKSVGNAVKKIAKSTIGKMALTFAAVYFMGPAGFNLAGSAGSVTGVTSAAASNMINTFAGSTLVNVASGQKIGDAIKGGIVSGALAGGTTAIFGGGVPGAPRDVPAPVIDKSINLAGTSGSPLSGSSLISALDDVAPVTGVPIGSAPVQPFAVPEALAASKASALTSTAPSGGGLSFGTPAQVAPTQVATQGAGQGFTGAPPQDPNSLISQMGVRQPYVPSDVGVGAGSTAQPGFFDSLSQGNFSDAATALKNQFSPSAIEQAGALKAQKAGEEAFKTTYDRLIPSAKTPAQQAAVEAQALAASEAARKAAMPGILAQYGPLAGLGIGAAAMMGGFTPESPEPPPGFSGPTGEELLAANPEKYGLSFGGVRTVSSGRNPYDTMYFNPMNPYRSPVQGGINSVARLAKGGTAEFPRKTGPINGPGTGTSDSVPAMLSDGEFVFTAKAVRAMGNGSRRKGAKRMYAMMKDLEKKGK